MAYYLVVLAEILILNFYALIFYLKDRVFLLAFLLWSKICITFVMSLR